MSANNITYLCQKAARNFYAGQSFSWVTDPDSQIVTGISSGEVALPNLVCQCKNADAAVPWEGNWSATLRITVRSNCDDSTADEHHERSGDVFGMLMTDTAKGDLSDALEGFSAQQVLPISQGWDVDEDTWVSWIEFQVECFGSDADTVS